MVRLGFGEYTTFVNEKTMCSLHLYKCLRSRLLDDIKRKDDEQLTLRSWKKILAWRGLTVG
jgi:hypothetical protein